MCMIMDHFTPFQSLTASHFVFHATANIIWGVNDIRVCDKHTKFSWLNYTFKQKKGQRWHVQIALGVMPGVLETVYMWNEGVSVSGAQARRGNGQCALSRNNSSLSNTKSPAHSRRPGGPSGTTKTPHRSPPSASFPPFTCSLVALLWLSLRRKRPNSRLTTRARTGQRKP